MVEKILEAVLSGLVVPILLELWKSWRNKTTTRQSPVETVPESQPLKPFPGPVISRRPRERLTDAALRQPKRDLANKTGGLTPVIARLVLSPLLGSFMAGIIIGFLEVFGYPPIEIGTALANALVLVCSITVCGFSLQNAGI